MTKSQLSNKIIPFYKPILEAFSNLKLIFVAVLLLSAYTIDKVDVNNQYKSDRNTISIVSWNIQDLGQTKNEQEIERIAQILRNADLIALQEIIAINYGGAKAVAKIVDNLNRMGAAWDYSLSDPTRSTSGYIKERYAFIWKKSKVDAISKPKLDSFLANLIDREPFIGHFKQKSNGHDFYLVNFHSRPFTQKPEQEIKHFINYEERLKSNKVIIAGDFNLSEEHSVWKPFYKKGIKPALNSTPTTLKKKCKDGEYLNHAIDNIYYKSNFFNFTKSGSIDFVKSCNSLTSARLISDHLPVFLILEIN